MSLQDRIVFFANCTFAALLLVLITMGGVALYLHHKPEPVLPREVVDTRPELCYHYYNDGTDQWKDCMGVGYVPHPDNNRTTD